MPKLRKSRIIFESAEEDSEVPWGNLVSSLAESEWFPFIKKGETRSNAPHPTVKMIEDIRAEQLRGERNPALLAT